MKHSPVVSKELTFSEQELLNRIRRMTQEHNLNNVTRTKAYLEFYLRHPEIHWAFLGHMVSRNGGWNMTDLKAMNKATWNKGSFKIPIIKKKYSTKSNFTFRTGSHLIKLFFLRKVTI